MKWYSIIMLLLLLPTASAVDLLNGTILNTTVSNTSLTFQGCELNVTQSVVSAISIELTNPLYLPPGQPFTLPAFLNITRENSVFDCIDLGPNFGTTTDQGLLFCQNMRSAFGDISLTSFIPVYGIIGIVLIITVAIILILVLSKRDALAKGEGVEETLKIAGLVILGMGVIALLLIITLFTIDVICIP